MRCCAGCGEEISDRESFTERDGRLYHRGTGCVLIDYVGEEPEIHPVARAIAKSKEPPPPSRQARWQQRKRDEGKCPDCGGEVKEGVLCDRCREHKREQKRSKNGWKAWVKGRPGRPPMGEGKRRFSL